MNKYLILVLLSIFSMPISYLIGIPIYWLTGWMTIQDSIIPLTISINTVVIVLAIRESCK